MDADVQVVKEDSVKSWQCERVKGDEFKKTGSHRAEGIDPASLKQGVNEAVGM